jgi:predicted esterase
MANGRGIMDTHNILNVIEDISIGDFPEVAHWETKPSALIILLHGIGSNARDFDALIKSCPEPSAVLMLLPQAPIRHVSLFRREMNAWSDILSGDFEIGKLDWPGFQKNIDDLLVWIKVLKAEYGFEKIIIGGFSQGGFNVWVGMEKLSTITDGMAVFSTSLNKEVVERIQFDLADYPFFYSYGSEDYMMPEYYCQKSEVAMIEHFNSKNITCHHAGHGHEIDTATAEKFWKWEASV